MLEKRILNPTTKEQAQQYATTVLEDNLDCKVKNLAYVGGGSFGFVFKADIDKAPYTVIIKACRTDGMCKEETADLQRLGMDSLLPVPKVYFSFLKTDEIPIDFICMEYVKGKDCFTNFGFLLKSKKQKQAFAEEITAAMHHWHEQTNVAFGALEHPEFDTWLGFYRPFALDILESARELSKQGKLEKFVLKSMERAWLAFDFIFSEKVEKASLIHGDLNVMNIMADENLKPTAIIDPLESKWADSEFDLFQLRNLSGNGFHLYETYKKNYPVSEKCDLKTSFYALYHEVYCSIISGNKVNSILYPLVYRMNKELRKVGM